jgi:hypothetical protein
MEGPDELRQSKRNRQGGARHAGDDHAAAPELRCEEFILEKLIEFWKSVDFLLTGNQRLV